MDNNIPNKNWFEKIFSLDEFKFSALVCTQFVFLGLDIYSFIQKGDIANNLLACNAYAIGAISGVNLIGMAINSYSNRNMNQYGINQYSQYGSGNSYSPYGNSSMGMNGMGMNSMMPNSTTTPLGQVTQSTTNTTSSMPKPY